MKHTVPDFLVVGAAKAGTTTLHDIFRQHPDICLPQQKETKFFLSEEFKKGVPYYIKTYFNNCGTAKISGEVDPGYMYYKYVPQRLFDSVGANLKIVFILRDPIDRAYSHYWMNVRLGFETLSFEEALATETMRLDGCDRITRARFGYLDRGRYMTQIRWFLEYFPREKMQFILFEDFIADTQDTVASILDFLSVSSDVKLDYSVHSNKSSSPRLIWFRNLVHGQNLIKTMTKILIPSPKIRRTIKRSLDRRNRKAMRKPAYADELRSRLLKGSFFLSEIEELESFLGRNLTKWKK